MFDIYYSNDDLARALEDAAELDETIYEVLKATNKMLEISTDAVRSLGAGEERAWHQGRKDACRVILTLMVEGFSAQDKYGESVTVDYSPYR
jgi:hypothetical protein